MQVTNWYYWMKLYRSVTWYNLNSGSSHGSICAPSPRPWSYLLTIADLSSAAFINSSSSVMFSTFLHGDHSSILLKSLPTDKGKWLTMTTGGGKHRQQIFAYHRQPRVPRRSCCHCSLRFINLKFPYHPCLQVRYCEKDSFGGLTATTTTNLYTNTPTHNQPTSSPSSLFG